MSRSGVRFFSVVILVSSIPLSRADELGGPLMGFIADPSGRAIRPIRGLPGSATIGNEIRFDEQTIGLQISPAHDAVLLRSVDSVRLATLTLGAEPAISEIPLPAGTSVPVAAFSPGGNNLAFFDNGSRSLHLLPLRAGRPGELRSLDLAIVEGTVVSIAVSDGDDPMVAGITEAGSASAFVADMAGNYRAIAGFDRPSSVAFLGGTRDLAFADSGAHAIWRILNPLSGSAPEALPSEGLGDGLRLVSSPDARTLLVLDGSRTIRSIDLRAGTVTSIECECAPAAGQALRGRSVFRVTEAFDQPLWILDAGTSDPRLLFIPASPPEPVAP